MDNLTHTLFALTLARTPLRRCGRGSTGALVLASNAPDVDIVAASHGAVSYLEWHRGPTHGLLAVIGLGLAVAAVVAAGTRLFRGRSRDASFTALAALSALGVAGHVLMDLPTIYGTRLLSPVDWHWFAVDWMPIVDVYLLAVLAAGLWIGRRSERRAAICAAAVLLLVGANYGLRATAHARALTAAERWLPPRCVDAAPGFWLDRWPQSAPPVRDNARAANATCLVDLAALPSFVSPFKWRIVARSAQQYDVADIDLWVEGGGRLPAPQFASLPAAPRAADFRGHPTSRVARVFLDFARFPTETSRTDAGTTTIQWQDVRFLRPPVQPGRGVPDLFTASIRIAADGRIVDEGLGR